MSDQYDPRDERAAPASVDATPNSELFSHVDTATLQRQHDALLTVIAGDPTVIVTLAGIMRNLIGRALVHPDRIKRDDALVADNRKRADAQAAASLKARQDAERERTLVLSPEDQRKRDADDLDRKHKAEQEALARQRAAADLDAEQAKERRDFAARQAEKRAQVFAPTPAEARDDNHPPTPSADRLQAGQQRQGPIYDTPRP